MRTSASRFAAAFVAVGLSLSAVGCGDSSLGTVSGTVSYEGTPIEKGSINFLPTDGKGASAGGEIVAGKYEVAEVPPGPKIVEVIAVKDVQYAVSSADMAARAAEAAKRGDNSGLIEPADVIPPNAVGNNATHAITAGDQTLDIVITKPGS